MQTNPFYLRSKQIRQVDKALLALETFLSPKFIKDIRAWKESFEGLKILKGKLNIFDQTQEKIVSLELEIDTLKKILRPWYLLDESVKDLLVQNSKKARAFLDNHGDKSEAPVLARYNRLLELTHLLPYADDAPQLCDAILHHMHKDRYAQNLSKILEKIELMNVQIKTVTRGFWVALCACIFVATLPICLPFSFTLWQRKRRLEAHINTYADLKQREQKRLALAEDGAQITEQIQSLIGNISYDQIRAILMEVKELKSEFYDPNRFLSVCAVILNYIDAEKEFLSDLFGVMPSQAHERFEWLAKNVEKYSHTQQQLDVLQQQKHEFFLQKKQKTKGYERDILVSGIEQLHASIQTFATIPLSEDHTATFYEICLLIPEELKKVREIIFHVNQNYDVDLNAWYVSQQRLQDFANQIALFVLDAEIQENLKKEQIQMDTMTPSTENISHAISESHLNGG